MKKPTELQQIQIDAIAKIEKHIEGLGVCPELATAKMSLEVNKRILYKLGFRTPKPKKVATQARKNPFKKKTLTNRFFFHSLTGGNGKSRSYL